MTVRGAASAALGGAVPNDGGLVLDLSHLDKADIDPAGEVCVVGAGARLRRVHRALARRGLALPVYPSNLGATLAGWLATGGAGLNAFGPGRVLDIVRAADVVLPGGELVRFHADGRLDVAAAGGRAGDPPRGHGHREVAPDQAEAWFAQRGLPPFGLADLAGSEGTLGVVTQLVVAVGRRPEIGAFLLGFADQDAALRAAAFIAANAGADLPRPANLELVSAAHRAHAALAAADDARQAWRRFPGGACDRRRHALAAHPRSARPRRGVRGVSRRRSGAAGRPGRTGTPPSSMSTFSRPVRRAASRRACPTCPATRWCLPTESVSYAAARFRPQQTKRLGPGLLAAEIELPAAEVAAFLAAAARVAHGAGVALEHEVYFLSGERALVIAGYLTDHRNAAFLLDLALTPGAARSRRAPARRTALRPGPLAGLLCRRASSARQGLARLRGGQGGARPRPPAGPRRAVRVSAARPARPGGRGVLPARACACWAPAGARRAWPRRCDWRGRRCASFLGPGTGGAPVRSGRAQAGRRWHALLPRACRSSRARCTA